MKIDIKDKEEQNGLGRVHKIIALHFEIGLVCIVLMIFPFLLQRIDVLLEAALIFDSVMMWATAVRDVIQNPHQDFDVFNLNLLNDRIHSSLLDFQGKRRPFSMFYL